MTHDATGNRPRARLRAGRDGDGADCGRWTMMPTETLRAMLDERGVEHYDRLDVTEWVGSDCEICHTSLIYSNGATVLVLRKCTTPEQAIAATLGQGTLSASQVSNAVYSHSIHADCADADWQAIADELNATLGRGACHNLKDSWPSLFECDECGYSNDDTYCGSEWHFKFCPNCGARVIGV